MQTATNTTVDQYIGYALLAAAIGATASTVTILVAFYVLNPTVITQAGSFNDFAFSTTLLGGLHMLFCGPPGCLAGAIAAPLPSLLLATVARQARGGPTSRGIWALLITAFVAGVVAGILVQWGMLRLYAVIFPNGISFNPPTL